MAAGDEATIQKRLGQRLEFGKCTHMDMGHCSTEVPHPCGG